MKTFENSKVERPKAGNQAAVGHKHGYQYVLNGCLISNGAACTRQRAVSFLLDRRAAYLSHIEKVFDETEYYQNITTVLVILVLLCLPQSARRARGRPGKAGCRREEKRNQKASESMKI